MCGNAEVKASSPKDKAPAYTVVIVIASIIVGALVSGLFLLLGGLGILGAGIF